jgi:hypothetical protein
MGPPGKRKKAAFGREQQKLLILLGAFRDSFKARSIQPLLPRQSKSVQFVGFQSFFAACLHTPQQRSSPITPGRVRESTIIRKMAPQQEIARAASKPTPRE